jgi:hypothetical protein
LNIDSRGIASDQRGFHTHERLQSDCSTFVRGEPDPDTPCLKRIRQRKRAVELDSPVGIRVCTGCRMSPRIKLLQDLPRHRAAHNVRDRLQGRVDGAAACTTTDGANRSAGRHLPHCSSRHNNSNTGP